MKKTLKTVLFLIVAILMIASVPIAFAQNNQKKFPVAHGPIQQINEHFGIEATTYDDGVAIDRNIINGPRKRPISYRDESELLLLLETNLIVASNSLTVPAYNWVFGCSAVSGSMIAGYYDRNGFSNIYTGLTDGGVIPLIEDEFWGKWTDSVGDLYPNNPLIASHLNLDGRATKGSIDDYWISYLSNRNDPYITGGWTQHAWGDAIGDFMKTSQSSYGNVDGSTNFYNWTLSSSPLTCSDMEIYGIDNRDGTYGRKLFYEARGYTVTGCYSQKTDNVMSGGFSFTQYKAEIDAGRPVFLNLVGHSIVGVGYLIDDQGNQTIRIHDTWDNGDEHYMLWGDAYSGMKLDSVSIVNIQPISAIAVNPPSYDFKVVNVGAIASEQFTISNTGTQAVAISSITIDGSSEFQNSSDACSGFGLNPGSDCTVTLTFSPLSDGLKSAVMNIFSNNPNEKLAAVPLSGTGYVPKFPDLTGSWGTVSLSGPNKKGSYTVSGTFTTENRGNQSASNVVVKYYLSSDSNTPISTSTIRSISAGSSKTTTINYSTKSSPKGKYLIAVIDPDSRITEIDEGNNQISSNSIN
jgi:hypothetical protein